MADLSDYLFMKEKHLSVRIIWSLLYVIFIFLTVGLIITLRREFLTNPTVTTLENTYHSVSEIPFPGIALCNINKISKTLAKIFAEDIGNRSSMSATEVLDLVPLFGKLYDFEYQSNDERNIEKIQNILENLHLNTIAVMRRLTYGCKELLKHCRWLGMRVNCSEIFKMRLTYDGYCCAFNYIKNTSQYKEVPTGTVPIKGAAGINKGLSVTVNNDLDDYFYAPLSSAGVTVESCVQVFEPTDYPDKPSGSLMEVMGIANTETFIKIIPTTVITVRDVINYPLTKRQCLFDEERITKFNGVYSQSDCHVDCRVASTLALCQCVPFMVPLSTPDNVCTLTNLQCLNRYKNKWNFIYPEEDTSGLLEREQHDSLNCDQICYPSCDGTSYNVLSDRAAVHNHNPIKDNETRIHIYYAQRFSQLYKQDVVYYWFEILSNFGGTFGLVIGMSIVSIIEFCLFCLQILERKSHG